MLLYKHQQQKRCCSCVIIENTKHTKRIVMYINIYNINCDEKTV